MCHEDMKPEVKSAELDSKTKESKNLSHNYFEDNLEAIFQVSQRDIDLDKAFEAEVKAGLVEPLDC